MHNTTNSFLKGVAQDLISKYKLDIFETCLIFPNYSVSNIFLGYLAQKKNSTTVWAPNTYTLEDFWSSNSQLKLVDQLLLLRELYPLTIEIRPSSESFEEFLPWGRELLNDFMIFDRFLIPVEDLCSPPSFSSSRLSDENRSVRDFWKKISDASQNNNRDWLYRFQKLPIIYTLFKKKLVEKGIAYSSLQQKHLLEKWKVGECNKSIPSRLAIIGKYFLSPVEVKLIEALESKFCCDISFYRDSLPPEIKNEELHPALAYRKSFPKTKLFISVIDDSIIKAKKRPIVEIIKTNSDQGQVTQICQKLEQLSTSIGLEKLCSGSTIVLLDSSLLIPLLSSLPSVLGEPRIMGIGYQLQDTPSYSLLICLLEVQRGLLELDKTNDYFYLKSALNRVLEHSYIDFSIGKKKITTKKINDLFSEWEKGFSNKIEDILSERIFNKNSDFGSFCILSKFFCYKNRSFSKLLNLIDKFYLSLVNKEFPIASWEREAFKKVIDLGEKIIKLWPKDSSLIINAEFIELCEQQASRCSLSFDNSKSSNGLTISSLMGAQSLEFDFIFVASLQEGILPKPTRNSKIIPNILTNYYGYPDEISQRAESTQVFYQLFYSTRKKVYAFYSSGSKAGGKSRYLTEIENSEAYEIMEQSTLPDIKTHDKSSIKIEKNEFILNILVKFIKNKGGRKILSPSAINLYLDCPLGFYLRYIAKLSEPKENGLEMDSAQFGTIFHSIMEAAYKPYIGVEINSKIIQKIINSLEESTLKIYQNLFFKGDIVKQSSDKLILNIISKLARAIIVGDEEHSPFKIRALEHRFSSSCRNNYITLSNGDQVLLGGVIDRIDYKDGFTRIVDYKTGIWNNKIGCVEELFQIDLQNRNKVGFQMFLYSWLYTNQKKSLQLIDTYKVFPTVLSTRTIFDKNNTNKFVIKEDKKDLLLEDISPYLNIFHKKLTAVLEELFDPNIPFTQCDNNHSKFCPCQKLLPPYLQ